MFTLVRQQGYSVDGRLKDLNQFQIGFNGVLVGYLPFGKVAQIQALFQFPHDALTDDELTSIALQAEQVQGHPVEVQRPEQHSRKFYEDALEASRKEESEDE